MPSNEYNRQLAEVAEQIRTQLEYLQELGVETAQEFAGLAARPKAKLEVRPPIRSDRAMAPTPRPVAVPSRTESPTTPAARLTDLPRLGTVRIGPRAASPEVKETMPRKSARTQVTPEAIGELFSVGSATAELPERQETLSTIHESIGDCTLCPLHEGRTHIVHTEGNPQARLMFVGEAPGADEDAQGRPFVGRAGQLLNKIIEAIGFRRDEVLIGNINRCRPPQNRAPLPNEVAACKPFLLREIGAIRPEVVVVMGNTAMKNLLGTKEGITKARGIFQDFHGIKVMPTFHPAYLLRDPSKKRETWDDLKKVRDYLTQAHS